MATQATISVGANTRQLQRDISAALNRSYSINLNSKGFSQPLGRITGQLGEFEKSLQASNARVIAFGASAGAIFAVQKALKATISAAITVEKQLADINVILGESAQGLSKFGNQLFQIAGQTGKSFSEVAAAAAELARQGLGVEQTLQRTKDALILTRLSGLDAQKSVESLTATINSFGKAALTSTEIVNKFAKVDAAFAVSSADLANAVARVGSAAQSAGVSFDELIAIVTSAQQTTARGGSVIGNSFKTIFTRIQRPKVLDTLEELGIVVRDIGGNTKPVIQILSGLAKTFDTLSSAQKSQVSELVGGVFQINILKAALSDLNKEYSIYDRALNSSLTATDEAVKRNEQLNETLDALVNRTFANLTNVGSKIGKDVFGPAIKNILGGINSLLAVGAGDGETKSAGEKIAEGIFKGFGKFVSGPGLILAGTALFKIFGSLTKFAADATKTLLSLNSGSQDQKEIQSDITRILSSHPEIMSKIYSGQLTVEKASQTVLNIYELERKVLQDNLRLVNQISQAAATRGIKPFSASTGRASGYAPAFAQEEAMAMSLGASKSVKAKMGKGTIGGKKFIMNDQEIEIPNFGRNGDSAVIPMYAKGTDIIPSTTRTVDSLIKGRAGSTKKYPRLQKKLGDKIQGNDKIKSPPIEIISLENDDIFLDLNEKRLKAFKASNEFAKEIEKYVQSLNTNRSAVLTDFKGSKVFGKSNAALDIMGNNFLSEVKSGTYSVKEVQEKFLRWPIENPSIGNYFSKFTKQEDLIKPDPELYATLYTAGKKYQTKASGYVPNFAAVSGGKLYDFDETLAKYPKNINPKELYFASSVAKASLTSLGKSLVGSKDPINVLTARDRTSAPAIRSFLESNRIPVNKVLTGASMFKNVQVPKKGGQSRGLKSAEKKAEFIKRISGKYGSQIELIDDAVENIYAVNSLKIPGVKGTLYRGGRSRGLGARFEADGYVPNFASKGALPDFDYYYQFEPSKKFWTLERKRQKKMLAKGQDIWTEEEPVAVSQFVELLANKYGYKDFKTTRTRDLESATGGAGVSFTGFDAIVEATSPQNIRKAFLTSVKAGTNVSSEVNDINAKVAKAISGEPYIKKLEGELVKVLIGRRGGITTGGIAKWAKEKSLASGYVPNFANNIGKYFYDPASQLNNDKGLLKAYSALEAITGKPGEYYRGGSNKEINKILTSGAAVSKGAGNTRNVKGSYVASDIGLAARFALVAQRDSKGGSLMILDGKKLGPLQAADPGNFIAKQGIKKSAIKKIIDVSSLTKGFASGYVPNYAKDKNDQALYEAIGREASVRPLSTVRVSKSSAFKNKSNPSGYVVTNTKDEPNGVRSLFAGGFVPNYAKRKKNKGGDGFEFGSLAGIFAVQQALGQAESFLGETNKGLSSFISGIDTGTNAFFAFETVSQLVPKKFKPFFSGLAKVSGLITGTAVTFTNYNDKLGELSSAIAKEIENIRNNSEKSNAAVSQYATALEDYRTALLDENVKPQDLQKLRQNVLNYSASIPKEFAGKDIKDILETQNKKTLQDQSTLSIKEFAKSLAETSKGQGPLGFLFGKEDRRAKVLEQAKTGLASIIDPSLVTSQTLENIKNTVGPKFLAQITESPAVLDLISTLTLAGVSVENLRQPLIKLVEDSLNAKKTTEDLLATDRERINQIKNKEKQLAQLNKLEAFRKEDVSSVAKSSTIELFKNAYTAKAFLDSKALEKGGLAGAAISEKTLELLKNIAPGTLKRGAEQFLASGKTSAGEGLKQLDPLFKALLNRANEQNNILKTQLGISPLDIDNLFKESIGLEQGTTKELIDQEKLLTTEITKLREELAKERSENLGPTQAAGYIPSPNFKNIERIQARALGAGNVTPLLSRGTIGGNKFYLNNKEIEIPGFGKNGDSAVIPTYGMGFIPNFASAAGGFVPNLAPKVNVEGQSMTINEIKRLLGGDAVQSLKQRYNLRSNRDLERFLSNNPNSPYKVILERGRLQGVQNLTRGGLQGLPKGFYKNSSFLDDLAALISKGSYRASKGLGYLIGGSQNLLLKGVESGANLLGRGIGSGKNLLGKFSNFSKGKRLVKFGSKALGPLAAVYEAYTAIDQFRKGDIGGGIKSVAKGALSAIPGVGIVLGAAGEGVDYFTAKGLGLTDIENENTANANLREQTKERIKNAKTTLQKQLAIANESGILPKGYSSLSNLRKAALEENLQLEKRRASEAEAKRQLQLIKSGNFNNAATILKSYAEKDRSQEQKQLKNKQAINYYNSLGSAGRSLILKEAGGQYGQSLIEASYRQLEKRRSASGRRNMAYGFIPNFASPISAAKKAEKRLTGSAILSYDRKIGPFVRSAGQPNNLDALIRRDHPEGLSAAIQNSYAMQGGGIPNFAGMEDVSKRLSDNAAATQELTERLDTYIQSIEKTAQNQTAQPAIQQGQQAVSVNLSINVSGADEEAIITAVNSKLREALGNMRNGKVNPTMVKVATQR